MSFLDSLFSIGPIRKAIWRLWYPFLTRRLQNENVKFLNYAFETEPPVNLPLEPHDESDRACIQLYHHVASQIDLTGCSVLEVSCGHGGGASWITRTMGPSSFVGLDLNPEGVNFCQQAHRVPGLSFIKGDAQNLPFEAQAFDAVINVEASHCYPNFPGFLSEVARVLKSGGHFLYADFRFSGQFEEWEAAIENAEALTILQHQNISTEVLRGMNCNSEYSLSLVQNCLPGFLQSSGRDFAGVPDSRVYDALKTGELSYRSWCLQKHVS